MIEGNFRAEVLSGNSLQFLNGKDGIGMLYRKCDNKGCPDEAMFMLFHGEKSLGDSCKDCLGDLVAEAMGENDAKVITVTGAE